MSGGFRANDLGAPAVQTTEKRIEVLLQCLQTNSLTTTNIASLICYEPEH